MRKCQFGKTDIGAEFYYFLCCPNLKKKRKHYIHSKYYIRPSTFYIQSHFKQSETLKKNCHVCQASYM